MNKASYRFWIAGPQHFDKPRVIVWREFHVEGDVDRNTVLDDIALWIPDAVSGVDPEDPATDPEFSEDTEFDHFFITNRLYVDEHGGQYVYEEPWGKWEGEFAKAMLNLKLRLHTDQNGTHYLQSTSPVTGDFNGWVITDWRVATIVPGDKPKFGELLCDVVVWEKDFSAARARVIVRQGWRLY